MALMVNSLNHVGQLSLLICSSIHLFFQNRLDLSLINRILIIPIPNVIDAQEVNELWPIGLCNEVIA